MNKKIFAFLLSVFLLGFNINCKSNKSQDCERKEKKIKKSKDRESQVQSFFDPTLNNNAKLENAFENPSRVKVFIREVGIKIALKYYVLKAWMKKNLKRIFS